MSDVSATSAWSLNSDISSIECNKIGMTQKERRALEATRVVYFHCYKLQLA